MSNKEDKNQEYLKDLLGDNTKQEKPQEMKSVSTNNSSLVPSIEYSTVNIDMLPGGRFYKEGTLISIRAAKVKEIQAYSVVDDENFVDITEKMNELLSRNVLFQHPNGKKGTYRDLKDADRMFIIFMIRELTFAGGNTLSKDVQCTSCSNEFSIPFRSTSNGDSPATFSVHESGEKIEKFWNGNENCYEVLVNNVSWKIGAPTIGIQEDFYSEIKRLVQTGKKPNVSFMKIMPYLLHDRSSITPEGITKKMDDYEKMNDLRLFTMLNAVVNNMTLGIKGLVMECGECGQEVHTDITFPGGASTLFELPDILDSF